MLELPEEVVVRQVMRQQGMNDECRTYIREAFARVFVIQDKIEEDIAKLRATNKNRTKAEKRRAKEARQQQAEYEYTPEDHYAMDYVEAAQQYESRPQDYPSDSMPEPADDEYDPRWPMIAEDPPAVKQGHQTGRRAGGRRTSGKAHKRHANNDPYAEEIPAVIRSEDVPTQASSSAYNTNASVQRQPEVQYVPRSPPAYAPSPHAYASAQYPQAAYVETRQPIQAHMQRQPEPVLRFHDESGREAYPSAVVPVTHQAPAYVEQGPYGGHYVQYQAADGRILSAVAADSQPAYYGRPAGMYGPSYGAAAAYGQGPYAQSPYAQAPYAPSYTPVDQGLQFFYDDADPREPGRRL